MLRPFVKSFRNRRQNCFLPVQWTFLLNLFFGKVLFFFLLQWVKKFWNFVPKTFSAFLNLVFLASRGSLWRRMLFALKKHVFPTLPYFGKNFSNLSWKVFGSVVKNAFCVSMETICGRNFFWRKYFFHQFPILGRVSAIIESFWGEFVKTASQMPKFFSRKNSFEKVFCFFWTVS